MPETVDAFPAPRRSPLGAHPKYDWPSVFDGRKHRFALDELPSTPRNFARQVRRAAEVYGVHVKIVTRKTLGVYVEATPKGTP